MSPFNREHIHNINSCVKPTKFKIIYDEDTAPIKTTPKINNDHAKDNSMNQKPNFLLEYSFPAVIFDRVCFSVNKNQQQSRFILNDCINYFKSLTSSKEQLLEQKVEILKSVNLSVPCGSIFGLLGPSSCGKTTLLRCLVGLLKPNSGSISLFGHKIPNKQEGRGSFDDRSSWNSSECRVPGQSVGYMPQDFGLYEDFTIEQLLTMFGRYMRMDIKLIKKRIEFMTKFLDLPEKERQISSLSGGQKRRVSFAIACLHMPPLIILDEPTVGVDPLLRKSIWKYLRKLASVENKTIIITTHYIEEAAQADQVALMRAGEILIQDRPAKIMQDNNCRTLEEAFLRICNNVQPEGVANAETTLPLYQADHNSKITKLSLPRFVWPPDKYNNSSIESQVTTMISGKNSLRPLTQDSSSNDNISQLGAKEKLALFEELTVNRREIVPKNYSRVNSDASRSIQNSTTNTLHDLLVSTDKIDWNPRENNFEGIQCDNNFDLRSRQAMQSSCRVNSQISKLDQSCGKNRKSLTAKKRHNRAMRLLRRDKFVLDNSFHDQIGCNRDVIIKNNPITDDDPNDLSPILNRLKSNALILWALLYKNYRRNINSIPLVAFQFLLPLIQMISFSLCVGGRPTNIGLGLVNYDQSSTFIRPNLPLPLLDKIDNISLSELPSSLRIQRTASIPDKGTRLSLNDNDDYSSADDIPDSEEESLSLKYLDFIDRTMISVHEYDSLDRALEDVRRVKLWAVMEIGENFTETITQRFDLENFHQLDSDITRQSIIKLYPDRSNKILDMICQRSLVDSYRKFLLNHFDHFKRLPIEVKDPIFDIKPNIISNSIDGYTESIAPGLLASLTYIMAAGLTTFIMVVERSDGILERTYTSGINPVLYLMAHALFRSLVMMLQIAAVLFLTFHILKQPLVGSVWLAYLMLMTLNITGISYGLLISSLVIDQNGAALTIVGSLVVKITLSGILWPFEAIPRWLRVICYVQPLTMPVQALKAITLKGATIYDRSVYLGFLVAISWMVVFLIISAKRFKFYQH